MYLARVVGNVVSTQKNQSLIGKKLLIVQQVNAQCHPIGEIEIAVDSVGAGAGEIVLISAGSSARQVFENENIPTDKAIVGIVDHLEVNQ
ncbi:EutN/CcmL family microcompartment protein [Thermohalobacter berrensis]|uniref:Ethanolamine utilization protein EutN n=1 Tax=Thermohalobacter berrensis TaxID=99594 RepID=A0A419T5F3_9FIRM|nr:EutN/CcmL family microcompartment protein [Thermohalobacter berrensis]RKD32760.1 ethanolamine utilization protein EutN [Thermohalobacter berrensis]